MKVLDHDQAILEILTCGSSPGAVILAIILGALSVLSALLLSLRKYASGMCQWRLPVSAVISAACQPLENDPDAAFLRAKMECSQQNSWYRRLLLQ